MKKIILYAPVDCEVKDITKCSDPTFSQKMLGDGIVVIPQNNNFNCPFEKAKVLMIFETKHAYGFLVEGFEVLIHCGINTVSLNGKPFEQNIKMDDEIEFGDSLFTANLDLIKQENLSIETPIVFSPENISSIKFIKLKEGFYKSGDKIAEVEILQKQIEKNISLKSFKSKYRIAAEEFVNAIGGKPNFSDVYNCMTRLRFKIIDKKIVNEEQIKKNSLVKGIVWNGLELQIIIGGENYKVKDEILNLDKETFITKKNNFKPALQKRIMGAIAGIMAPNVPILMGAGIISAFYSIMVQTGIALDLGTGSASLIAKADVFSAILFIMSKTGLLLVGVFFCVNTVKYFGGNYLIGIFIGLALSSRFFWTSGITESDLYSFGHYIESSKYSIQGWYLFSISDYPIVIRSYEGGVLPFIVAALVAVYTDKWIKTWMPTSIDIIFRSALVFVISLVPTMFVLGPFLSLIEFGMSKLIFLFSDLPIGIGIGLMSLIWQPLVLTGVHVAVVMVILIPFYAGTPSALLPALGFAVWAQVGVAIGIYFKTKNKNLKTIILGALPGGCFGISEPIIYGVTLPKGKPFLLGCVAAFFAGMLSGILGIKSDVPAGMGIFSLLGYKSVNTMLLALLTIFVAITFAALLCYFFYNERKNEYNYSKKISNKLNKIMQQVNYQNNEFSKIKITQLLKRIKEEKHTFANYEKFLAKSTKIEAKIMSLELKEEKQKNKLYSKAIAMSNNSKIDPKLTQEGILRYNNFSLENDRKVLIEQKFIINKECQSYKDKYNTLIKELETLAQEIVSNFANDLKIEEINTYYNGYWNAIHSVDIGYGYEDEKKYNLSRENKRKLKTLNI